MSFHLSILRTEAGLFVRRSRKAIVGLVVPFVTAAAIKVGLDVDDATVTAAVSALVTSLAVYLTPNQPS
jgi:hypothetical protein